MSCCSWLFAKVRVVVLWVRRLVQAMFCALKNGKLSADGSNS